MLRIFIDNKIPFIKGLLESYAEVCYFQDDVQPAELKKADILLIRTRTVCGREILDGSNIKCIVTATIGTDHIDLKYCYEHGIKVFNAAGCNSGAVMQYVFTCLYYFASLKNIKMRNRTLGVVGVGNTGSKVALLGQALGFKVMRNDPYKIHEPGTSYYDLNELCSECDIISFHVPLTDCTYEMINDDFLVSLKNKPVLINSSRGSILNRFSVYKFKDKLGGLILDVWPGEPKIDNELLAITDIATPHIAGYSLEGKINGTVMSIRNIAGYAGIMELACFNAPAQLFGSGERMVLDTNASQTEICKTLLKSFPVNELDKSLRENPQNFEAIRSANDFRREISITL